MPITELPPVTIEGWFALHQVFAIDWPAVQARTDRMPTASDDRVARNAGAAPDAGAVLDRLAGGGTGWSAGFRLIGGGADVMVIHFRDSLEALADAALQLRRSPAWAPLRLQREYLSVTELGLHQATADAAEQAPGGSAAYRRLVEAAAAGERAAPHAQSRLYPRLPDGMPHVCFYPMSRRRTHPDNWYSLSIAERARLMREHGLSARAFAGRVFQVITGAVGLDDWEWGVTLFARDPLEFKRIVTDLRYDEASARYGEFGPTFTGIHVTPAELTALLA